MSDSSSGFDWFSILAILVAGGISIFKGLSNKSKKQSATIPRHPEYTDQEEEGNDTMVEGYNIFTVKEEEVPEISVEHFSAGDYYKEPVKETEDIHSIHTDVHAEDVTEENEYQDFDIRQAVISSEILRRPQY